MPQSMEVIPKRKEQNKQLQPHANHNDAVTPASSLEKSHDENFIKSSTETHCT